MFTFTDSIAFNKALRKKVDAIVAELREHPDLIREYRRILKHMVILRVTFQYPDEHRDKKALFPGLNSAATLSKTYTGPIVLVSFIDKECLEKDERFRTLMQNPRVRFLKQPETRDRIKELVESLRG